MAQRICSEPECERAHRAKGLCAYHYRLTNPPAKLNAVECPTCGMVTMKRDKDRRFCSLLCRDVWRLDQPDDPMWNRGPRGPRVTHLPDDHPAMWCGKATPVAFGACAWCGLVACRGPLGNRAYCSEPCRWKAKRVRRRGREAQVYGFWSWSDFMRIARRFGYRCAYCNDRPTDAPLQPDHVIPVSKGGANNVGNLLPSCLMCNADKRDLSLEEWSTWRASHGKPPRAVTWGSEDKRYHHLMLMRPPTSQMA